MTGQASQAQRRRAPRSTAISTTASTTITTSTQIHSNGLASLDPFTCGDCWAEF